ncbi:MAG: cob(I)yrinic acid a,c-diamide adenosyltransferase [Vicinamibacterales bacterium]
MRIYTRTGDTGETALFDGTRVGKDDPRIVAYGEVDELNAALGVASSVATDDEIRTVLTGVQRDLHALASRLADPGHRIADRVSKVDLGSAEVEALERLIDRFESQLPPLRKFILYGGAAAAAQLHLARAVARRAERHVVSLGDDVEAVVLSYLNRLSDLLFVLARVTNHRAGIADSEW